MRIAFPHELSRAEVRSRIKAREQEIAGFMPAMSTVTTTWPSDDRMDLALKVMGKAFAGAIEIGDQDLTFEFDLPPALAFAEPMIRAAIEPKARKLLA